VRTRAWLVAGAGLALIIMSTPVGAGSTEAGSATVRAQVRAAPAPAPMTVELSLDNDQVRAGRPTRARAVARNLGDTPVHDVELTLHAGADVRIRAPTVTVGVIGPGDDVGVDWSLCSAEPDHYLIQVRARGVVTAQVFEVFSTAVALIVEPAPGRSSPSCPDW
jgi:hypothetical protein